MAFDITAKDQASERGNVINSANAQLEALTKRLHAANERTTRLIDAVLGPQPEPNETSKPTPISSSTQDHLRDLERAIDRLETTIGRAY